MAEQTHSLREAYRSARAESGISARRIVATAAAAVTMALVSSQLTSVLNSLLLVAVVSIGSALVSEFYRILLSVTAEGTKKVAETTKRAIDPLVSLSHDPDDATKIIDAVSVDKTMVHETVPAQTGVADSGEDLVTSTDYPVSGDELTSEDSTERSHTAPEASVRRGRTKSALRSNQFVQLSLLFGLVALLTVGVSYAVASSQGQTDITYNYSSFRRDPLDQLTAQQKQELVDLVQNQGGVQGEENQENSGAEEQSPTTGDSPAGTETPETLLEQLATLQTELRNLTTQNQELTTLVEELKAQLATETAKTDGLQQKITELEAQVETLSGTSGSPGSSTVEPAP